MSHLRLTVRVHSVIIKFNSVSIAKCSPFLPPAPVLMKGLKVITLHQCVIRVPVNGRLPSHAPVYVSLNVAQDGKKTFGEVFLRVQIVLLLPRPIFTVLDEVPDQADYQVQLARLPKLCYIHAPDCNMTGRTGLLLQVPQRNGRKFS